jgi:tRNA(fMet)-specific endonuclease VapC
MTLYVVDTDILSLYQRNHLQVCTRIRLGRQNNLIIKTTVIKVAAQYGGRLAQIRKAQNPEALILAYDLLTATFSQLEILKYDRSADDYFRQQGIRIGIFEIGKRFLSSLRIGNFKLVFHS